MEWSVWSDEIGKSGCTGEHGKTDLYPSPDGGIGSLFLNVWKRNRIGNGSGGWTGSRHRSDVGEPRNEGGLRGYAI